MCCLKSKRSWILLLFTQIPLFCTSTPQFERPRLFRVDLDAPPRERWNAVLDAYRHTVIPRIVEQARSYVPSKLRSPLFSLFGYLVRFLPSEYAEELKDTPGNQQSSKSWLSGMADHLADTGITLGELVALNLLYDVTDFSRPLLSVLANRSAATLPPQLGCMSILAAQPNGQILHGRNLDYGMTRLLKDATILVDFVRDGHVQFTSVSFVLYNGVLTGQRADAFTLSLNARYAGGPWDNLVMELLTRFRHPVSYELRRVLDTERDYAGAVHRLRFVPLVAPAYIIIGGTNGDGAILTRSRLMAVDVFPLDYLHHRWFLLETNYDHWREAGDRRRRIGRNLMKQIGPEHISPETLLFRVLSQAPVLNEETVFSTVMSAQNPQLIYNFTGVWGESQGLW